jgi:trans-2,3-dihydro-3-hydroxyanthranilate isomerase
VRLVSDAGGCVTGQTTVVERRMKNTLEYAVVDVFTDRAFAGNPLAVVLDADRLSTEQMQSLAREFNLSETTFVLPPTTDEATYRARVFTATTELPFAGHPSVGTAWLLVHRGRHEASTLVQECGAGLVQIVVDDHGAMLTGAAPTQSGVVDEAPYLQALGLLAEDLDATPLRRCGCGLDWGFLRVADDALGRIALDATALTALPGAGVCVFSYRDGRAHARVFAGGVGVSEDPATGSAALGLGVFLVASGLLPADGESSYEIAQGVEIGRPSRIVGQVIAAEGRPVMVRVAGGVAEVAAGRIRVPPP